MSKVKLLISGLCASGKTTLLKDLENVLILVNDGKAYPFGQPHGSLKNFTNVSDLISIIEDKINKYKEKYKVYPETLVIDSISKTLLDIESKVIKRVASFPYGVINTEIKELMDFIEEELMDVFNIILVSHVVYDTDTDCYSLINAGGSWGKKGGVLSEVDQAIFVELKKKNRLVHFRNSRLSARTTLKSLPDNINYDDFNLNDHINILKSQQNASSDFEL